MKQGMHPLIMGNWKMNPQTPSLAQKLTKQLKRELTKTTDVDVVLVPPSIYIDLVSKVRNGSKAFLLGLQNVHDQKLGPFTGEIALTMGKDFDVSYIIVGHSERRAMGEKNEDINKKVIATLKEGLTPVLCIGESKRDSSAKYLSFVEEQIRECLAKVPKSKIGNVVIAYEPIWAISSGDGKGETATPADAYEMKLFIEKVLTDLYGRSYARKVRIIYGGSVNEKNATEMFEEGEVDGFLVGGASLKADRFSSIVQQVQKSLT